jgi:hypothetical protein
MTAFKFFAEISEIKTVQAILTVVLSYSFARTHNQLHLALKTISGDIFFIFFGLHELFRQINIPGLHRNI